MTTGTVKRLDADIQRDVLAELAWDQRVQPNEIGVIVTDGVVTLTGWVDSYLKKWAAEEAAHRVRGVTAVANDIEVRLPSYLQRTDAELAEEAIQALERDAVVAIKDVKVTVSHGEVTLRGQVDWEHQKHDAERAIRRLPGVRRVINLLTIRPRDSLASPAELKKEIEDALLRSAAMDAERIVVEVRGDKVRLMGVVRSFAEKREAERVAWSAPGITEVENLITVNSLID
jgi:osmotically-inducible protein OsmY